MKRLTTHALVTSFLALAPVLTAGCLTGSLTCGAPRTPHGIYALVNVDEYLNNYQNKYGSAAPADYFKSTVYPGLMSNPDVSGITLYVTWSTLNPSAPPAEPVWTLVQDLLSQAATSKKTVQLVVTPGINSPKWLLGDIGTNNGLLYTCDYLFSAGYPTPPAGKTCGKVTFSGFIEGGWDKATMTPKSPQELPMPWDSTYKNAWHTFLSALAAKFGSDANLVSIAVAGPTASSEEMMLPANQNTNGVIQFGSFTPGQVWNKLLAKHYTRAYKDHTKYLNSDVAIIDEWENAIDFYGKTFSGITLTMSTGDGLPNLDAPLSTDVPCDLNKQTCSFTVPTSPIDFYSVCRVADMDCAAETTILNHFLQSTVGGANAKATMTDGMKGGAKHGNLGVPNVKLISQSTDLYTSPSQRILGGAQFATSFSEKNHTDDEGGCSGPTCTPEQAEYNVLVWFFDGTSEGPNFPSGTVAIGGNSGSAPLNYLQIYGPDITYATTDVSGKVAVTMGGSPNYFSAQDLLHKASLALAMIAEK